MLAHLCMTSPIKGYDPGEMTNTVGSTGVFA
jgi:hypothetical protein